MTVIISSSKAFFNYCQDYERYSGQPIFLANEVLNYSHLIEDRVEILPQLKDVSISSPIIFLDFIWLSEELYYFCSKNYRETKLQLNLYEPFQKKIINLSARTNYFRLIYHLKRNPLIFLKNILYTFEYDGKYYLAVKKEKFSTIQKLHKYTKLSDLSESIKKIILRNMNISREKNINIVLNNKLQGTDAELRELLYLKRQTLNGEKWYIKNHPNKDFNEYNEFLNIERLEINAPSEFLLDEKIKIHALCSLGGEI
jgi:hypothetical protein